MKKIMSMVLLVVFVFSLPVYAENIPNAVVVSGNQTASAPLLAVIPIFGPKKLIAVSDFENKTNFYGNWNLGTGMTEQLTTALMETNRFIVLERQAIDDVLKEQDFAASDRTTKEGGAKTGGIYRSQILIKGAITEFSAQQADGGGVRIKGFQMASSGGQAAVTVDIRIYDTTTSEVLASKMCKGIADNRGTTFAYNEADWGIGGTHFKTTPLGEATREAIERTVDFIIAEMNNVEWKGRVIKVSENMVYINAGARSGVKMNDEFTLYGESEALVDPDTGMNLGTEETKIGAVKIVRVEEKFSKGEVISGEGFSRGNVVKFES